MQQEKQQAPGIDKKSTAILVMDYQNEIVERVPDEARAALLESASSVLSSARKAGMPVFYIVVRFKSGHPEISARNKAFAGIKSVGRLVEGTPGAEIHPKVAPQPGDIVLTKIRVGAFSTTPLETLLRAQGISSLVLLGIATSGVVLSTIRWAADMDYALTVVSDACADFNAETHRVLMGNVFPGQAEVMSASAFRSAVGG